MCTHVGPAGRVHVPSEAIVGAWQRRRCSCVGLYPIRQLGVCDWEVALFHFCASANLIFADLGCGNFAASFLPSKLRNSWTLRFLKAVFGSSAGSDGDTTSFPDEHIKFVCGFLRVTFLRNAPVSRKAEALQRVDRDFAENRRSLTVLHMGGPNSEIDATLENAPNPTSLQILEAFGDPQGGLAAPLGPAAAEAAGRDPVGAPPERPASLMDQLLISTGEACNSGIILAPCQYTLNTDQSNVESEELDYGDSDDEDVEAVVEDVGYGVVEDVGYAMDEDVGYALDEDAGHAVDEDAGHAVDEDVVHAVDEDVDHAVDEDVGRAVDEDVGHAVGEDAGHAVDEDVVHAVVDDVGHAVDEDAGHAVDEDVVHAVDEDVDHAVVEGVDHAVDEESGHTVDEDVRHAVVEDFEGVAEDFEAVAEDVEVVDEDVDAVAEDVEVMDEDVDVGVEDTEAVVEELVSTDQEADTNDEPLNLEELRSADEEADQVKAVVTDQAFSNITPNQLEDTTEEVTNHKDVDNMLEHLAGAHPGDAHTMNTALKLPQVGETSKVVPILERIPHQQEDQDDGTASDQKRRSLGVEEDASNSSTMSSSSSNTCT